MAESNVSVIVTCHNYARFLAECLDSIFAQTALPDQVLVVDDSSNDDPQAICGQFPGVEFHRVEVRCPMLARQAGFMKSTGRYVLFVDADNRLSGDYLAGALAEIRHPRVAAVYADYQMFGDERDRTDFPEFRRHLLFCGNFFDSCSLFRRDALELIPEVWEEDYGLMPEDYLIAQRLVQQGWELRKQGSHFFYRCHGGQGSKRLDAARWASGYISVHGADRQPISLFVPLSGRTWAWTELSRFLERQAFPHEWIRLVLCDVSQNSGFAVDVRDWASRCDYTDVRYFAMSAGLPELFDWNALGIERDREWNLAMCRIFNRLRALVDTDYCWILADDLIPPDDVLSNLLNDFAKDVMCVAAAYSARDGESSNVWIDDLSQAASSTHFGTGQGVQDVRGTGFGCLVIRSEGLRSHVFSVPVGERRFEVPFFKQMGDEWRRRWDADCRCQRLRCNESDTVSQRSLQVAMP